jgi:exonuclease SbcD
MRFIHTADWHLGRVMYNARLTDDQAHVLEQVVQLARDWRPNALVLSGDVYDRAVPPPEAVELLDDVLSRIVLDVHVPVICIAGNHDSAARLEFGAKVLAARGLYVFGTVSPFPSAVTLEDEWGPVHFYPVPFGETSVMREKLACQHLKDHDGALRELVRRIRDVHPLEERAVLVAHVFVAGAAESESERPLSIGGSDRVEPSCFDGFHYAALGHLHRSQQSGSHRVRYPGSLLKYSFSESDHTKSVDLVEIDGAGTVRVESITLTPRRDVRRISGFLKDVLNGPKSGESRADYVMVTLEDRGPILDVMGKIREIYPNALHVERMEGNPGTSTSSREHDHRKMKDSELFALFFREVTGVGLTEAEAAAYEAIGEQLWRQEREAADI